MNDAIDIIVRRFEMNIDMANGSREVDGARQAAYECARILREIDPEVGELAVEYLRENGL